MYRSSAPARYLLPTSTIFHSSGSTPHRSRLGKTPGMKWWGLCVSESYRIPRGKVINFISKSSALSEYMRLERCIFIYFPFLENPSDIEIYPGALVIGAVCTVICMDVMNCGGRERNLQSPPCA